MVLKEFFCLAHGRFESGEPVCPKSGCTTVEQRHYTAPGIRHNRTAHIDKTLDMVARDFGLTDMNNHGGTTAARVHSPETKRAIEMQEKLRAKFAPMPRKGGAPAALAEYGAPASNLVQDLRESGALVKPNITQIQDPQNLQVSR